MILYIVQLLYFIFIADYRLGQETKSKPRGPSSFAKQKENEILQRLNITFNFVLREGITHLV